MHVRAVYIMMPALRFLSSFGFIFLFNCLSSVIVVVMSFATRAVINHVRLFIRRTNRVLINAVNMRRLFFLNPSSLWLTTAARRPKPVLLQDLRTAHVPIFGFLS